VKCAIREKCFNEIEQIASDTKFQDFQKNVLVDFVVSFLQIYKDC